MKSFKKLLALGLATALGTSAISSTASAEDFSNVKEIATIQKSGVLRVGVKNDVVGFSVKDPLTGEYVGFEDTLATMIAKEIGPDVEVEFTAVTAATRSELIDSGDLDCVLATFTITPERKKNWDFSTPYYQDAVTVLVEKKNNIKTLSDLIGKTVGVSSGSTSAKALVQALVDKGLVDSAKFDAAKFDPSTWTEGVKFHQFDNYPAISTALAANEVQAFCVDKSILNIYKTASRDFIEDRFAPQEYGVVTKKGSGLTPFIESLIQKWLADGTIEKLIKENNL
ncbi:MAG: transporter substrate-binding domain-containing protein [Succinivibrio sp.]